MANLQDIEKLAKQYSDTFAALSDLLAALQGIAEAAREAMLPGTSANTRSILLSAIAEDARAAIRKATGEQS